MATQSSCEKQKPQQGEVPAGPKNEVASVPGDTRGTRNPHPGASVSTVSSDPAPLVGGALRGGPAGSSSCNVAAAGAFSLPGEDPGLPSVDCVWFLNRAEASGGRLWAVGPPPSGELQGALASVPPRPRAQGRAVGGSSPDVRRRPGLGSLRSAVCFPGLLRPRSRCLRCHLLRGPSPTAAAILRLLGGARQPCRVLPPEARPKQQALPSAAVPARRALLSALVHRCKARPTATPPRQAQALLKAAAVLLRQTLLNAAAVLLHQTLLKAAAVLLRQTLLDAAAVLLRQTLLDAVAVLLRQTLLNAAAVLLRQTLHNAAAVLPVRALLNTAAVLLRQIVLKVAAVLPVRALPNAAAVLPVRALLNAAAAAVLLHQALLSAAVVLPRQALRSTITPTRQALPSESAHPGQALPSEGAALIQALSSGAALIQALSSGAAPPSEGLRLAAAPLGAGLLARALHPLLLP
ncbi:EZH inhibitory protein [Vicugna pacos]|uniref:EZH inhibitory protein n=1 Tax=Vicugna pacos TaxID=30538 RepID=A0ABM5CVW7_VICPA